MSVGVVGSYWLRDRSGGRDILRLADLTFIVQNGPASDAEINAEDEPDVERLTRRNAEAKLKAAVEATRNRMPWDLVVVAADTSVSVDDVPLGKPTDRSEAESIASRVARARAYSRHFGRE